MNGALRVVVEGPRVVELETRPPLAAKILPPVAGLPGPRLVAIGSAAGLLEGDEVTIELSLGPGARLSVLTCAATLAHPCPGGGETASAVHVRLGPGAVLAWLPEPLVACGGCRHRARASLDLAPGAAALWAERVAFGRSGEAAGVLACRLDVTCAGAPLLRDALAYPQGADSPAVFGGCRHTGSLHLLGLRPRCELLGLMPLAGPGATLRGLEPSAAALERRLGPARRALLAELPSNPSVPQPPKEDLVDA